MTVLCTDKTGTLTSAQIELAGFMAPDGKTNDRPAMLAAVCAQLGGDNGSLDKALTKARPDAHNGWTRRGLSPFDYQRRMGAVLADGPEGFDADRQGRARGGDGSLRQRRRSPFRRGGAQGCVGARAGLGRERPSRRGGRLTAVDGRAARSDLRTTRRTLVFEGLCTFADPPKATAPAAVARLAAAGVRVVILSGDDPLVVGRLAKIVGLRAQQAIVGADLHVALDRRPAGANARYRRLRPAFARPESADRPRAA